MNRWTVAPVALTLAAALTGCSGTSTPERVTVPDVVGDVDVDAWYAIHEAGLEWDYLDADDGSAPLTAGESPTVLSQQPRAGAVVEPGSTVLLDLDVAANSGEEEAPAAGLADRIEDAFSGAYGWPDDQAWEAITGFSDRDAPRVTVVTDLYDKAENSAEAEGICMAVASLGDQIEDFTGVYVTAGEGGPFLAECDAVR